MHHNRLKSLWKFKNNLVLTIFFFMFTVVGQFLYYSLHETLSLQIPTNKYVTLFIILFIFSFIRQPTWRFLSMGFIFLLSLPQMIHLEFFGLPVHPTEIYLLFTQAQEVFGTIREDLFIFIRPSLIVLIPITILWKVNKRFSPQIQSRYLFLLFIFYFAYNPVRTYMTGNQWGRQPSTEEFDGMNIYLSLSYFLGKILPHKLTSGTSQLAKTNQIKLTATVPLKANIIVVQGESLSPNHMSLFGYKRKTTPYLDSLKEDPRFIYRKGISSGVSTDIAVAFFMNATYGINGNQSVFSAEHCLFKLAHNQKFETYFYSTQSQQQLRYITNSICPKYIKHYKSLNHIQPELMDENKADDHKLVSELKKVNLTEGNKFVLLHQRGSHSPYSMRYNELSDIFTFEEASSPKQMQVNFYDNSVYHFDLFMKDLIEYINSIKTPTLVYVISDHGEALGEEGIWGHGMLKKPAFEIPILLYANNEIHFNKTHHALDENPTHLNVSLLIAQALGYKANVDILKTPKSYTVLGNDIDGFAGYIELFFNDGKLIKYQKKEI